MGRVNKYGRMDHYMKDSGIKIKPTSMEDSFILMETCMKGSGKMIKLVEWANTFIRREEYTRVNGKMISKMERDRRVGQMEQTMMENTRKDKRVDVEYSNGVIKAVMKAISVIIKSMVMAGMHGQMEDYM